METHKGLLNVAVWVLFVQGVICIAVAMYLFIMNKPPLELAVHGIGGAVSVLMSAVVAVLRRKL